MVTRNEVVRWDEGRRASVGPRVEPALVQGRRVLLDGGLVVGGDPGPDRFSGFESLPERLGGGFLFWSEASTERAESFLGPASSRWRAGAVGGVQPWLNGVLLRTARGVLVASSSGGLASLPMPGIVDGAAVDERRGMLVDRFGRVYVTLDGDTFRDLTAERQLRRYDATDVDEVVAIAEGRASEALAEDRDGRTTPMSRELPGAPLMTAVAFGAELPSGDLLAVVDGDLNRVSTRSAGLVGPTVSLPLANPYDQCQVVHASEGGVSLACVHDGGGHVLVIQGDPRDLRLEATFGPVAGFQTDPAGRMAAWGSCGSDEPTVLDFARVDEEADDDSLDVLPDEDEARVCVRLGPGRWETRWIRGRGATRIYRWVLGADGLVTALVLPPSDEEVKREPDDDRDDDDAPREEERDASKEPSDAAGPTRVSTGVRVVELATGGEALRGGWFAAPQATWAWPGIDRDFWIDEAGHMRGWLELPEGSGDERPEDTLTTAPAPRRLPVALDVGGPAAGITIESSGKIVVHEPPEAVTALVRGGPYAVAMSEPEGGPKAWYETVDGGRSWRRIDGPPAGGDIERPPKHAESGCTRAGCTWGSRVVRLGWGPAEGGPPDPEAPPTPAPPTSAPSATPRAPRLELACRFDGRLPDTAPDALTVATLADDAIPQGFDGKVRMPFAPSARPRKLKGSWVGHGSVAPLLRGDGSVDLLIWGESHIARGGDGFRVRDRESPRKVSGVTSLVELASGKLLGFEARRAGLVLVERDDAALLTRLNESPSVDRLTVTLARGGDGAIGLLGYRPEGGPAWVGSLDLGKAEIGRLESLADFSRAEPGDSAACAASKSGWRAVLEVPVDVRVRRESSPGGSGPDAVEHSSSGAPSVLSVRGDEDRLCVDGIQARSPSGPFRDVVARFSHRAESAVHAGDASRRMQCELRSVGADDARGSSPREADR